MRKWAGTALALAALAVCVAFFGRVALVWFRVWPWPSWWPDGDSVPWAIAALLAAGGLVAWLGWVLRRGSAEPPADPRPDGRLRTVDASQAGNPYRSPET